MKLKTLILSLILAACGGTQTEKAPHLAQPQTGKADGAGYSDACWYAAIDGAFALEQRTGFNRTLVVGEWLGGYGAHGIWRFGLAPSGHAPVDGHMIVTTYADSRSSCRVLGVQDQSNEMALIDDGATLSSPVSKSCEAPLTKLVNELAAVNGSNMRADRFELVDAHSDHEVIRVLTKDPNTGFAGYTLLANAETFGGDPCVVYGVQSKEIEVDLRLGTGSKRRVYHAVRDLQHLVHNMAREYELVGQDNNWLAFETLPYATQGSHASRPLNGGDAVDWTNSGFSILKDVAMECAFSREGAYGEHISYAQQKKLAGKFVAAFYSIQKRYGNPFTFESLTHYAVESEIINSGCTVRISAPAVSVDVLFDSHSFD